MSEAAPVVQMIPIEEINVLNPRSRNQNIFRGIVSNIATLGLKRPITVARRSEAVDGKKYDLVCGQGRLEAFTALGQTEIPAIVKEASREECFLMGMVENIARRQLGPLELLREIGSLRERGYNTAEVSRKVAIDKHYVSGITQLLKNGEERLLPNSVPPKDVALTPFGIEQTSNNRTAITIERNSLHIVDGPF